MTALEEEPMPVERRASETPLPEQSTRFLGNVALETPPEDLCDSILQIAAENGVQTPAEFNTFLHAVLVSKVQIANRRNGRPENAAIVNPQRVTNALADYYSLFTGDYGSEEGAKKMETARTEHLAFHGENARSHMYTPEINYVLNLEPKFRERAGDQVGDAALELLAAYGWAIRGGNGYAAARIDLFRKTEKTHLLANKRKPRL